MSYLLDIVVLRLEVPELVHLLIESPKFISLINLEVFIHIVTQFILFNVAPLGHLVAWRLDSRVAKNRPRYLLLLVLFDTVCVV